MVVFFVVFSFLLPFFLVITSSTCILTSTTSKPVIYFTCSLTKSVTLRKILGADSPYSKITFKSTAACFSPTSTDTPVVTLFPLEKALVTLSAKPPFVSKIPLTSRAAIPAIFQLLHLRKLIIFELWFLVFLSMFCCSSLSFSFTQFDYHMLVLLYCYLLP